MTRDAAGDGCPRTVLEQAILKAGKAVLPAPLKTGLGNGVERSRDANERILAGAVKCPAQPSLDRAANLCVDACRFERCRDFRRRPRCARNNGNPSTGEARDS